MTITIQVSETQIKILQHLENGLTQKEVAQKMEMELTKLKMNIYLMCEQFGCKNSTQLVCYAIRNGMI